MKFWFHWKGKGPKSNFASPHKIPHIGLGTDRQHVWSYKAASPLPHMKSWGRLCSPKCFWLFLSLCVCVPKFPVCHTTHSSFLQQSIPLAWKESYLLQGLMVNAQERSPDISHPLTSIKETSLRHPRLLASNLPKKINDQTALLIISCCSNGFSWS